MEIVPRWEAMTAAGRRMLASGRYAEAEAQFRQALTEAEETQPESFIHARSLNNVASANLKQMRYRDAAPRIVRALAIAESLYGADDEHLIPFLSNLAEARRQEGDLEAIEPLYVRSIALCRKASDEYRAALPVLLLNLGSHYIRQRRYREADATLNEALVIHENAAAHNNRLYWETTSAVARVARLSGNRTRAEAMYRRSLELADAASESNHPDMAAVLCNFGALLLDVRKLDEAQRVFERSLAISEMSLPPVHTARAGALHGIGAVYHLRQDFAQADHYFSLAEGVWERMLPGSAYDLALTAVSRAESARLQKRNEAAKRLYARAFATVEHLDEYLIGADFAIALGHYVPMLRDGGDGRQAERIEQLCKRVLAKHASRPEARAMIDVRDLAQH